MRKRRPLSRAEWLIVGSPLLIFVLVGAWKLWRNAQTGRLLASDARPTFAAWAAGDQVVSWGLPAAAWDRSVPARAVAQAFPQTFSRWNIRSGDLQSERAVSFSTRGSSVSPDGRLIASFDVTGAPYGIPRNGATWLEVRDLTQNLAPVARWKQDYGSMSWSPDSRELIMCDLSRTARVYDARTGALRRTLDIRRWLPDDEGFRALSFSRDGRACIVRENSRYLTGTKSRFSGSNSDETGPVKGRALVITWPGGALRVRLPGDLWDACAFAPDGRSVVGVRRVMAGYNTLRTDIVRFDVASRRLRTVTARITDALNDGNASFNGSAFTYAAFSPDARLLVTPDLYARGFVIWNAATGEVTGTVPTFRLKEGDYYAPNHEIHFSPDGKFLLRLRPEGVELVELRRFLKPN